MLIRAAKVSVSCPRNLIFNGRSCVSSYVSLGRFRIVRSFAAFSVSAVFPLVAQEANNCCRLDVVFGVPSVALPRFVVLTGSTGGASRVSHCATACHIFRPSFPLTDSMAAHRPSAINTGQSTFTPSYVAITKPALFCGMHGGLGYT